MPYVPELCYFDVLYKGSGSPNLFPVSGVEDIDPAPNTAFRCGEDGNLDMKQLLAVKGLEQYFLSSDRNENPTVFLTRCSGKCDNKLSHSFDFEIKT